MVSFEMLNDLVPSVRVAETLLFLCASHLRDSMDLTL